MVNKKIVKKKSAKCHKCGYKWQTKSKMEFVVCPKCLIKVRIKKKKK